MKVVSPDVRDEDVLLPVRVQCSLECDAMLLDDASEIQEGMFIPGIKKPWTKKFQEFFVQNRCLRRLSNFSLGANSNLPSTEETYVMSFKDTLDDEGNFGAIRVYYGARDTENTLFAANAAKRQKTKSSTMQSVEESKELTAECSSVRRITWERMS